MWFAQHCLPFVVRFRPNLSIGLALFILLSTSAAYGAIAVESATLGFEGIYKRNRWTPLEVGITSQGEAFEGELRVEVRNLFSGTLVQTYVTPLALTRTDRQRRVVYLFLPDTSAKLTLMLVNQKGEVRITQELTPELPKQTSDLVLLAVTPERDVLHRMQRKALDTEPNGGKVFVSYADVRHLPAQWKGYDAVDVLVLRGVSLIGEQQHAALIDWIEQGGTLIVSSGADFHRLRASTLAPILPGRLTALETHTNLPDAMQRFSFQANTAFNRASSALNADATALVGQGATAYVAQTACGNGQVIDLAFDYSAPPFAEPASAAAFWGWLLGAHGKSPRHAEARYDPARRHEEKLQVLLNARAGSNAPLIRRLGLFGCAYILSIGGLLWWTKNRIRHYWVGGLLLVTFFSGVVFLPRSISPSSVSLDRFSILSAYADSGRSHLQSYMGLIASANTEATIAFKDSAFVRPLTPTSTPPLTLVQGTVSQLRNAPLDAWVTRAYFSETFIDFPADSVAFDIQPHSDRRLLRVTHHLPYPIENAWLIRGNRYTYLGDLPSGQPVEIVDDPTQQPSQPFPYALSGVRRELIQILTSEGVLRYILQETQPKIVGWVNAPLSPMRFNLPVRTSDETLILLYLPMGSG